MTIEYKDLAGTGSGYLERDRVIDPAGGTIAVIDTGLLSWPGQSTPADGSVFSDGTRNARDFTYKNTAPSVPLLAGGGLDFSTAVDADPSFLKSPANIFAPIWAETSKRFIALLYVKLPSAANWPSAQQQLFASGSAATVTGTKLFAITIGTTSGSPYLNVYRGIASGAAGKLVAFPAANITPFQGQVCQIAVAFTALGTQARIKSAAAVVPSTPSLLTTGFFDSDVTLPTSDFSGQYASVGVVEGQPLTGAAKAFRFYRFVLEGESAPGVMRDPITVADADLVRFLARNRYS